MSNSTGRPTDEIIEILKRLQNQRLAEKEQHIEFMKKLMEAHNERLSKSVKVPEVDVILAKQSSKLMEAATEVAIAMTKAAGDNVDTIVKNLVDNMKANVATTAVTATTQKTADTTDKVKEKVTEMVEGSGLAKAVQEWATMAVNFAAKVGATVNVGELVWWIGVFGLAGGVVLSLPAFFRYWNTKSSDESILEEYNQLNRGGKDILRFTKPWGGSSRDTSQPRSPQGSSSDSTSVSGEIEHKAEDPPGDNGPKTPGANSGNLVSEALNKRLNKMIEGANIAANHYTELAKRDDTRASRTRLSYSGMLLSSLGVFVAAGPGALQRSGFVSAIVPIRLTTQQFFIVSLSPVLASYLSRLFDVWMGAWIARTHKYAQWAALWKGLHYRLQFLDVTSATDLKCFEEAFLFLTHCQGYHESLVGEDEFDPNEKPNSAEAKK